MNKINTNIKTDSIYAKTICKTPQNKTKLLDLSKIQVINNILVYKTGGKKIEFENDNTKWEYIAEGTYGIIVKSKSKTTNDSILLKIFKKEKHSYEEIEVIEYLEKQHINCNIINAVVVNLDIGNVIIMNRLDGDLSKLKGTIRKNYIPSFINEFISLYNCLVVNGLGYLDIKLDNILYKCIDDTNLILRVGDLGSIGLLNTRASTYTYKSYEDRYSESFQIITNEKNMIYIIGITILDLLQKDNKIHKFFSRKQIHKKTSKEIKTFVKKNIEKNKLDEIILTNGKPLSKLILNILHADPMERMNFSQLMNYLKISS